MGRQTARRRQAKPPAERRREILAAALELFEAKGFDATAVQDIAATAGVAAGTVYLYFPSKEHVLLAIHEDFHHEMEAAMQAAMGEVWQRIGAGEVTEADRLATMVDAIVDGVVAFLTEHRSATAVMCRYFPRLAGVDDEHDERLAAFVAAAIEAGRQTGRIDVSDPDMTAQLLTAAVSMPFARTVAEGTAADVERLAEAAKELFFKTLAP